MKYLSKKLMFLAMTGGVMMISGPGQISAFAEAHKDVRVRDVYSPVHFYSDARLVFIRISDTTYKMGDPPNQYTATNYESIGSGVGSTASLKLDVRILDSGSNEVTQDYFRVEQLPSELTLSPVGWAYYGGGPEISFPPGAYGINAWEDPDIDPTIYRYVLVRIEFREGTAPPLGTYRVEATLYDSDDVIISGGSEDFTILGKLGPSVTQEQAQEKVRSYVSGHTGVPLLVHDGETPYWSIDVFADESKTDLRGMAIIHGDTGELVSSENTPEDTISNIKLVAAVDADFTNRGRAPLCETIIRKWHTVAEGEPNSFKKDYEHWLLVAGDFTQKRYQVATFAAVQYSASAIAELAGAGSVVSWLFTVAGRIAIEDAMVATGFENAATSPAIIFTNGFVEAFFDLGRKLNESCVSYQIAEQQWQLALYIEHLISSQWSMDEPPFIRSVSVTREVLNCMDILNELSIQRLRSFIRHMWYLKVDNQDNEDYIFNDDVILKTSSAIGDLQWLGTFHTPENVYDRVYQEYVNQATERLLLCPPRILDDASTRISPETVIKGQTFTLYYNISNPLPEDANAWLGATIEEHDGGYWASDEPHDEPNLISPGVDLYSRQFTVPPDAPPGQYDVVWGLHSGHEIPGGVMWAVLTRENALTIIENHAPDTPINVSPANRATRLPLVPTLKSSDFLDSDPGNSHRASRWQIRTNEGGYEEPLWDSGEDEAYKISVRVPSGKLSYSTRYYWRLKHQDNTLLWSNWSAETSFVTHAPGHVIIYVDDNASNDPGTGILDDPFRRIQDAIDAAFGGQEIIVLDGMYVGDGNRDIDFLGKAITLRSENGPESCTIDCQGSEGDPHRGFFFHNGEDERSIVRGVTITNGYALDEPYYDRGGALGGGIYCLASGPTVDSCVIKNCFSDHGAGIHNSNGAPVLINCTFSNNVAGGAGGGLFNHAYYDTCTAKIDNCKFNNNVGSTGGGMTNFGYYGLCEIRVTDCCFSNNISDEFAGGGMRSGSQYGQCNATLIGCSFNGNSACGGGGALYARSKGLSEVYGNDDVRLTNCTFLNNSANIGYYHLNCGGAIFVISFSTDLIMSDCTFSGNTTLGVEGDVFYHGGAIGFLGNRFHATNCIFNGNSAQSNGGAIWYYPQFDVGQITNCTFVGNSASLGGGVYSENENEYTGIAVITNSILWDNLPNQVDLTSSSSIAIAYSDIQGGWPGLGNINVDPYFANATARDYHLKSQVGRWNPNDVSWVIDDVTSPCIDAGNPGSQLADEPASLSNVRINMGAYGGTAEASKTPATWGLLADLTNDRIVDFQDFARQTECQDHTGSEEPGDLDRDGQCTVADVSLLSDDWLKEFTRIPEFPNAGFEMGNLSYWLAMFYEYDGWVDVIRPGLTEGHYCARLYAAADCELGTCNGGAAILFRAFGLLEERPYTISFDYRCQVNNGIAWSQFEIDKGTVHTNHSYNLNIDGEIHHFSTTVMGDTRLTVFFYVMTTGISPSWVDLRVDNVRIE